MKLNIHIDRLVLDGLSVPYHRRPELQGAVETELARLFTVNVPSINFFPGDVVPDVPGGMIQGADDKEPGRLGQQIAQAVYEGVNR